MTVDLPAKECRRYLLEQCIVKVVEGRGSRKVDFWVSLTKKGVLRKLKIQTTKRLRRLEESGETDETSNDSNSWLVDRGSACVGSWTSAGA